MPNVSLTFKFLDAANQPRNWTDVDQAAIGALNLTGLNSGNTAQFSGTINVAQTAPCASWTAQFDALAASYRIFSDAAGTQAVGRDAAPCIGSLIANDSVTLYLQTKPPPVAIAQAVNAAVVAPGVNVLANAGAITTYLQGQQFIRVYIPASKSFGHQTTTCGIVRRLIALGYTGTVEVIYKAEATNPWTTNAGTIQLLLPELGLSVTGQNINPAPNNGQYQSAALGNCVFTFTAIGDQPPASKRQFGISGGVDDAKTDPRPICNTDYFLMLQPFQWNAANSLYVTQNPQLIDLGNQAPLGKLKFPGTACYWIDLTAYTWNALAGDLQRLSQENQTVVTDIQAGCCAANATKLLLPVYGLHNDADVGKLSNWIEVTQSTALANLVLAVLRGQANPPLNFGTVILTLDTYPNTWFADLQQKLPANYQARVTAWQSGDAWNNPIPNLANNAVLIVNLPKVLSAPLFNYFYLYSPLPPVFEGKGTMPVMLNSGRPYLQLSKQKDGYDTITAVTQGAAVKMLKVFLYPTVPFVWTKSGKAVVTKRETVGVRAQSFVAAGNAMVRNSQAAVTIDANTFPTATAHFAAISAYLQNNFYVDSANRVQAKFKALLSGNDFEQANFPAEITKALMYSDLQTACGADAENVCTEYLTNIAALTTFFSNALGDAETKTYFTDLATTHFHDVANDKLLKGMGFAVAAIAAGM
jgi:hypothetical protein